jgi:hypothetical protein
LAGLQRTELQRDAVQQQLTRNTAQRWPGRLARVQQVGRQVVEVDVLQRRGDAELALFARLVERHVVDLAHHTETDPVRAAAAHRFAHVVARVGVDRQRQVTVHPRGVGARERGGEVEFAGETRLGGAGRHLAGAPAHLGRAFGVGVGQAHVVQLRLDAFALHAPGRVGLQAVERHVRVFENIGQCQRALGHADVGAAAGLVDVEVHRGARDAGPSWQGEAARDGHAATRLTRQRQAAGAAFGLVGLQVPDRRRRRLAGLVLPAGREAFHPARRLQLRQAPVCLGGQGQAAGDGRERAQFQPLGAELGARAAPVLFRGVLQAQPAAGPVHAFVGTEAQVFGGHGEPGVGPLRGQAPLQVIDRQRRQFAAELDIDVAQRQVGRDAGHRAVHHIGPGAQRALARAHLDAPGREVRMGAQPFHVHVAEVGVELAGPVVPGQLVRGTAPEFDQRFAQPPEQAQARAPFGRRRGVDPELVRARGVAGHEGEVVEHQRGLAAQVIGPAHGAVADHELAQGKEPIGGTTVAFTGLCEVQASHLDAALRGAPHVQHRLVDHDLLEVAVPEGAHRQRSAHQRQVQGDAALRVEQLHVAQLERRHQGGQPTLAVGGAASPDLAHLHRSPYRAAGPAFQLRTPFADSGHNPPIQHGPARHEQGPSEKNEPQTKPGCHRECLEGSPGRGDGSRALIHVHRKL